GFHPGGDLQGRLERELRARIGELPGEGTTALRIVPAWSIPADALGWFASTKPFDLVVVGTQQRHGAEALWHGSVARAVMRRVGGSILCVPARASVERTPRPLPAFRTVLAATDRSDAGNA